MTGRRYALISPCRDEAKYLRRTLDSVARQSVPPSRWVVVDDGSTDETPEILAEYRAKLAYLTVVRREDRGARKVGPGVVEAFYAGLESIALDDFDYVCKLDVDLDLPERYFETLMVRMEHDPRLGTCSGKPYFVHPRTGRFEPEICGDEMSVGMSKFYRVECFREVGGFVPQVMWDGIDCHRCRMLGWIAESVDVPELRFEHLRPMGSSHKGLWTGRLRWGYGQYFMGTAPLYLLASAAFRVRTHPVFMGSVGMIAGYASSAARALPRYEDAEFRKFLRAYQRSCLLLGKKEATRRLNESQASVWEDSRMRRSEPR
jgi:glycosyltransferase involved in cell wall biosynthesis